MADDQRWATPIRDKLSRLARVKPNPTRLIVDAAGNLLHVDTGAASPHMLKMAPRHTPYKPHPPLNHNTPIEARASLRCT